VRVAVLGAGLQGVCTALELSRRGAEVELVDQDERPLNRASLRNEGKIHLGFVYAKDASLETAALMLDGALSFGPLVDRWTGGTLSQVPRSRPFTYLVAHDSMVGPDGLEAHYASVDALYRERRADRPGCDYLGLRPTSLWSGSPVADMSELGDPDVTAAYRTEEVALDVAALATLLRRRVASDERITVSGSWRVEGVEPTAGGYRVTGSGPGGPVAVDADQVVNALWEGRLAVDETMGAGPAPPWVHRLKYRILARLPRPLWTRPSVTIVLGAFGDVVVYGDGTAYVSWYPACLRGWSRDVVPPAAWDGACRGSVPEAEGADIARRSLDALGPFVPGLDQAVPFQVDAGVIVATGRTDITDGASGLHRRDEIGVRSIGGYHTVDTGKLTTAPLFAVRAADAVMTGVGSDPDGPW
jgi:glycine/D-amino acid oxidase-like deaminating enzyme